MMALINSLSTPCIREQCDLFSLPMTDTSVESSFYVEYKPQVSIQDAEGKLEFKVCGNTNQNIDMNDTFLYSKIKVVNEDGSPLAKDVNVSSN